MRVSEALPLQRCLHFFFFNDYYLNNSTTGTFLGSWGKKSKELGQKVRYLGLWPPPDHLPQCSCHRNLGVPHHVLLLTSSKALSPGSMVTICRGAGNRGHPLTVLESALPWDFSFNPSRYLFGPVSLSNIQTVRHDLAHGVLGAYMGSRDEVRMKEVTSTDRRDLECWRRSRCRLRDRPMETSGELNGSSVL